MSMFLSLTATRELQHPYHPLQLNPPNLFSLKSKNGENPKLCLIITNTPTTEAAPTTSNAPQSLCPQTTIRAVRSQLGLSRATPLGESHEAQQSPIKLEVTYKRTQATSQAGNIVRVKGKLTAGAKKLAKAAPVKVAQTKYWARKAARGSEKHGLRREGVGDKVLSERDGGRAPHC